MHEEPPMGPYRALYYPYIHFRDDAWVKMSALYWDQLMRIVPQHYPTDDSETVKQLGGLIEKVEPGAVKPGFADTFEAFFDEHGAQLQAHYALDHRDHWPVIAEWKRPPSAGGASGADMRLGYIRHEAIDPRVYQAMEALHLASTEHRGEPWIGMHPRLAAVYMHALAQHLAEANGLRPLTDRTLDHFALSQLTLERLASALLGDVGLVDDTPSPDEVETTLVSVAFRTVVPADVGALPVEKILAFREAFPAERHRFQRAVDQLLRDRPWLASIDDPAILEQRLRDEVDASFSEELEGLKERLASVGIDSVFSSANLTTTLPAAVAGGIGALGLALNPIAAGAAEVAMAAIPMLLDKRKAVRDELDKSSIAFLYRMEQDLQPKDLQTRCTQSLRRFVLGH
jgi:hypothetical protein